VRVAEEGAWRPRSSKDFSRRWQGRASLREVVAALVPRLTKRRTLA